MRDDVVAAWRALAPTDVLRALEARYAAVPDIDIRGAVLEVAACSLADQGRSFVSDAWKDLREPRQLGCLAAASAACLPFQDGFTRVTEALERMDEKLRRENMSALACFHRPETLDWIESHVSSPVTESWGRLAAASRFDWRRAVTWLESGRPVSLVALDALAAIVRPETPFLRKYGPELRDKPDQAAFEVALNDCVSRDAAPRVKMTVRFLIEHAETLTR